MKAKVFEFTNQPNLLLTIDWLTLNVDDVFSSLIMDENNLFHHGDFKLELIPKMRTANFNKVFTMWYQGQSIATISSSSNSQHILLNRAHLKFENSLFYDGRIKDIACAIVENFSIKFISISRLDLACDGVYLHNFLNSYLYHDEKTSIRTRINRYCQHDNIQPVNLSTENIRTYSFDSFYIGQMGNRSLSRSRSERFIRYYNKTREVQETGKKQYVLDYYKNNGFDLEKDVYRFEIQFSSSHLAKLKDFNWLHIFEPEKLQKLFQSGTINLFDFYYKEEKKPAKYCTKVVIFKDFAVSRYERIKKEVLDKTRTIRVGIKRMVSEILTGTMSGISNIETAGNAIRTVSAWLKSYNLRDWFLNRYPHWLKENRQNAIKTNGFCPNYQPSIFFV